jgi:hypothetical protein
VDKDHVLQNLRTSDNGTYIEFLRDRLNTQGIEAIACDLGDEARGHRYACCCHMTATPRGPGRRSPRRPANTIIICNSAKRETTA